jgi:hypothetical protein
MTELGGAAPAIVTVVTAVGTVIAFLVRRRDTQKDPIPKQAAAMALAEQSIGIAAGTMADQQRQITALRGDVEALHAKHELAIERANTLEKDLTNLGSKFATLQATLTAAAGYIESLLRHIRSGLTGPSPKLPADLRELIDPSLHDWPNPEGG